MSTELEIRRVELGQTWCLMPVIPALWKAKAGGSLEPQEFETLGWWNHTPPKKIYEQINQVWWFVHVVLATWEAEEGGLC